jgi:hypothetical protein
MISLPYISVICNNFSKGMWETFMIKNIDSAAMTVNPLIKFSSFI